MSLFGALLRPSSLHMALTRCRGATCGTGNAGVSATGSATLVQHHSDSPLFFQAVLHWVIQHCRHSVARSLVPSMSPAISVSQSTGSIQRFNGLGNAIVLLIGT